MMKFQRRILPPHSSSYFEMEEYLTPSLSRPSNSVTGSSSDLSEIESVCSVSTPFRQKSDSLTNLFHLSEDNTSVSNLSLASYSPSQHSADCNSPATFTSLSTQSTFYGQGSDKSSRTRRSMCSLNSNSQKSFSIKTADTALSTMATHPSSSDKCGLIANDGNDLDDHGQASDEEINVRDNAEDSHLDTVSLQSSRGLRKTVLNNVDRFLNSGNKQIKL